MNETHAKLVGNTDQYVGRVNAASFGFYPAETLLCVGWHHDRIGSWPQLRYNPNGWNRVQAANGRFYQIRNATGTQPFSPIDFSPFTTVGYQLV